MPIPLSIKDRHPCFTFRELMVYSRCNQGVQPVYPDSKCMGLTVFDYDDDGDWISTRQMIIS